jgi:hypothetical protein
MVKLDRVHLGQPTDSSDGAQAGGRFMQGTLREHPIGHSTRSGRVGIYTECPVGFTHIDLL